MESDKGEIVLIVCLEMFRHFLYNFDLFQTIIKPKFE